MGQPLLLRQISLWAPEALGRLVLCSPAAARPAVLRGWRLSFDKRGFDGSGRANVTAAPDGLVHGVLYDLEPAGLEALKGFETGYDLVEVRVEAALDGEGPAQVPAFVFVARPDRRTRSRPSRAYVALILQGLEEHGLPAAARQAVEQASGGAPR